jgi:hypothetical protein
VAAQGVALGAIVLNRLSITVVEAALLLVGVLLVRRRRREQVEKPEPEPA